MSSQDSAAETGRIHLNDEDVTYLMNVLRNAAQPVSTQQLIDVLRRQSDQAYPSARSGASGS